MAAITVPLDAKQLALRSLPRLPPFSATLNRLLATLAREDVSFSKIADLIEKDTILAGNVLGLVNSAMYARRGRVNSVRHAVSLLGVSKLRNAALSMSVSRLWGAVRPARGWSMRSFNQHSLATAILTDLISQAAPIDYPEGGFAAGLLHDVGELLLTVGLPDSFAAIRRLMQEGRSQIEAELDILGFHHAELSAEALAMWNLPEPIQAAARYHLDPTRDPSNGEARLPLSFAVWAADSYVTDIGIGCQSSIANEAGPSLEVFCSLQIGDQVPNLLSEFHTEFNAIRDLV